MGTNRAAEVDPLRGPALQPGDKVRLVSPASFPDRAWVDESIGILRSWGLVPELGRHALDRHGYLAGTDCDRLADLHDAFADPDVRAIITTRGGAGSYRIADDLDLDVVRADPKPVVGFSDITSLHVALWSRVGLVGIHGCLAGERATATVRHLLMDRGPMQIAREAAAHSASIDVPGHARGPLVGGNLRELAGSVGTRLRGLRGAILLIEEFRTVGLGQVDRNLTQMLRSGMLDGLAGVALGLITGFDGYEDRGWEIRDVLRDRLGALGVPVLGGLLIGHGGTGVDGGPDQDAVPIGAIAEIDVGAGTLTVESAVR